MRKNPLLSFCSPHERLVRSRRVLINEIKANGSTRRDTRGATRIEMTALSTHERDTNKLVYKCMQNAHRYNYLSKGLCETCVQSFLAETFY